MDFKNIEKKLFACILFVSFLASIIYVFVNSLLSLSNLYFLTFGFSEKELALINISIAVGLIAVSALAIDSYLKSFFHKRKKTLSLTTMPALVTNCLSEFVKGYKDS